MAKQQSAAVEGLKSKGVDVSQLDDQLDVDPITTTDLAKLASDEAFMNERVVVRLFPTTNVNDPPYALLNVNGQREIIPREQNKAIKRMHLEVLARMKETRISQAVPDGYVGSIGMESLRGHTALVYPFQVIEDKNKRGAAWLAQIMSEAA